MKSKNAIKSILSIFFIFILILNIQQIFAQGYLIEGSMIKVANSTLNLHDDLEVDKVFYEAFYGRRMKKAL